MRPRKIFIVEDNEHYAMLLHLKLKDTYNYSISTFATGEACVNNLDQKPDLIILDYALPGINGIATIERVKKYDKKIPIVVISAQGSPQIAADLIRAGAVDYLQKGPDTVNKLDDIIMRII